MANFAYDVDFTIQDLIDLKVHFGHRTGALNPKMRDYIFGTKNGISIIDVRKTYKNLVKAINYCYKAGKNNKKVLFVGTAVQMASTVKEFAEKCNQFYVTDRWLGGILTNWYTVSKSIKTLLSYNKVLEDKENNNLSKKEILTMTKQRDKLMASFGGLMNLKGRPDLVIVLNTKVDYLAVREANSLGLPTIAILDTDSDIENVTFPIISNDESMKVCKFYCEQFAKAIIKGQQDNMKDSGVDMAKLLKQSNKNNEKNNEKGNDKKDNGDN